VTDEDLRELERRARAGGPAEKLALASALDRVGRSDDALDALIAAREDPEARREIARRIGITQDVLHLQSCSTSLPPLARAPRARWAVRPRHAAPSPGRFVLSLLATPLGVVRASSESIAVLDPTSGARRHLLPGAMGVAIDRGTLYSHDFASLRAHDLWTGESLWAASLGRPIHLLGVVGDRIVCRSGRVVVAFDLRDRKAPSLAWTADVFDEIEAPTRGPREVIEMLGLQPLLALTLSFSPRLIVASESYMLRALDPADGRERWRAVGSVPLIDAVTGDAVFRRPEEVVVLASVDGVERWRTVERLAPIGLAERAVVCQRGSEVVVLEREDGRARARFAVAPNAIPLLVRDVVVAATSPTTLAAFSLDGERLWSFEVSLPSPPSRIFWRLASLPRAIVAATLTDDAIVCLEEGESR
jgi:hypothetical protein